MMFKSKLATFVSALVLAGSTFASTEKPAGCPNMTALQSEGLTMAAEILDGMFITYNLSHYNTPSNWVFIMGPVAAASNDNALEEGNKILSTLSGTPDPEEDEDGSWLCAYETGSEDLAAFAIQTEDMISPLQMNRYLRKGH